QTEVAVRSPRNLPHAGRVSGSGPYLFRLRGERICVNNPKTDFEERAARPPPFVGHRVVRALASKTRRSFARTADAEIIPARAANWPAGTPEGPGEGFAIAQEHAYGDPPLSARETLQFDKWRAPRPMWCYSSAAPVSGRTCSIRR